jgi:hypothetical protein
MSSQERVPGDRIGAGDLIKHAARFAGVGRGSGGVRGEELVPGGGQGDAGLENGGVGFCGCEGEVVPVAGAHARQRRPRLEDACAGICGCHVSRRKFDLTW